MIVGPPFARQEAALVNARLGPFELIAQHGRGGMAEVWRGRHDPSGQPVAVKVMSMAATRPRAWYQQFAREIRAVARLDHPAVVRVHDHGLVDEAVADSLPSLAIGAPYLVMEWLDGGPVSAGPAAHSWPALRAVLLTILDGLAHTHARGVIHRDITPDNVLLGDRGPVLTDFGLAVEADQAVDGRRSVGTPGFMAPEQITGQPHLFGPPTDLYAVGCLGWALLTGGAPHERPGLPPLALAMAHLYEPLPTLAPRFAVPVGARRWLKRVLARAPAERFRFAADAAHALRAWTAPLSVNPTVEAPRAELPADWRALAQAASSARPLLGGGRSLLAHRTPPPVGREAARDRLWQALRAVLERGGVRRVCVAGPSGQGKSYLVDWLAEHAHQLGVAHVLRATHEQPNGPGCGPGPMLARAVGLHEGRGSMSDQARDEAITALLPGAGARARARLRALMAPDGRGQADDHLIWLRTPREWHQAFGRTVMRLNRDRPVLVVLDDLQWGADAQALVAAMRKARPAPSLLFVATVRTDVEPSPTEALAAFGERRTIRLGPLEPDAHRRLLRAQLPLAPAVIDQVVERAGGSPLFSTELIQQWVATAALVEGPRGLELAVGAEYAMPDGLEALWRGRLLEALGPLFSDAHDPLEIGAVIGLEIEADFWVNACGFAGVPWPAEAIARLLDTGLLRDAPGDRLRFAHAMLRESIQAMARRDGRWMAWNACCAEVIAQRAAEGLPIDGLRLARYLLAAEQPARALAPLRDAGRAALTATDQARATKSIQLRLQALRRLRLPAEAEPWADVLLDSARLEQRRGAFDRARRRAKRALRHPAARSDPARLCRALHILSLIDHYTRGPRAALRQLERALPFAERAGDRQQLAWHMALFGFNAIAVYRFRDAERAFRRGLSVVAEDDRERRGHLYQGLSGIYALQESLERATRYAQRARAAFEGAGLTHFAGATRVLEGDIQRWAGDLDGAQAHYDIADARLRDFGPAQRSYVTLARAMMAIAREDWPAAWGLLDEVDRHRHTMLGVTVSIARLCCLTATGRWSDWEAAADALADVLGDAPASSEVPWLGLRIVELARAAGQDARAARAGHWVETHRMRVRARRR